MRKKMKREEEEEDISVGRRQMSIILPAEKIDFIDKMRLTMCTHIHVYRFIYTLPFTQVLDTNTPTHILNEYEVC